MLKRQDSLENWIVRLFVKNTFVIFVVNSGRLAKVTTVFQICKHSSYG